MEFPKNINIYEWQRYLERNLTVEENIMFTCVRMEKQMNMAIDTINEKIKSRNLHVSHLTNLHGNCLFESLVHLGYGDNADTLRQTLSYLFYIFGNVKNFFDGNNPQEESLKELFAVFNEIEYVYCKQDTKYYKYNFDIMCQDFSGEFNWTRLPTQLILMFISRLFNIKINIINNQEYDNNFEHVIDCTKGDSDNIYLGHIGETHYVPISKLPENSENDSDNSNLNPRYEDAKRKFFRWAINQSEKKIKELKEKKERELKVEEIIEDKTVENVPTEFKEIGI